MQGRIGIECAEVVTFAPASATGRIEGHFALTGGCEGGKNVGAAASRAWRRCDFGLAVALAADKHAGRPA